MGESEFFGLLAEHGLRVRLRYSRTAMREVTGYAVAQPPVAEEAGMLGWVAGGRLGPELALPRLRRRWRGVAGFDQRDTVYRWAADTAAAQQLPLLCGWQGSAYPEYDVYPGDGPALAAIAAFNTISNAGRT